MSNQQERRKVKRIDCFDRSVSNVDVEHSLVVDISDHGAGLLILKESQAVDNGNVHLTIFHPDRSLDEGLAIDGEIAWVDHDYSDDHRKVGVRFIGTDAAQESYVDNLTRWLSTEGHYFLHCELEKR